MRSATYFFILPIHGVVPFVQRVVKTHVQAGFFYSLAKVAGQISMRAGIVGVPVPRLFAEPEGKTIMMFAGEDHVSCPGFFKYFCPLFGVKKFGFELVYNVLMLKLEL